MTFTAAYPSPDGGAAMLGINARGPYELVEALREGLSASAFDALAGELEVTQEALAQMLAISPRTLSRRLRDGRFKQDESERILRLARIVDSGKEVFSSRERLRHWLKQPAIALGNQPPLSYLDTDVGVWEVERLLGRLKYGIPT